ncbi:MAG: hypothetical protein LBR22_11700 [Desulfovibrio sp.]|jgi:hypothetical protein|nr:hypothetical protein [Desulfovibrio sp.]
MEVCIATMRGRPVMLSLLDGIAHIDGAPQPIKRLTEEELAAFAASLDAVTCEDIAGRDAMLDAKRAAFVVELLGRAVGDDCVTQLTHILDHLHYNVQVFLGEATPD